MDLSEITNIPVFGTLYGLLASVVQVFSYVWWFLLPLALIFILWDIRLKYIQLKFIKSIKWTILEMRVPKENLKSPKAMEQVFASLYATYSGKIKGYDKIIKGKVEGWTSWEMVGHEGGVHFYIRTPVDHRNLIESAIFSQYPDAEINEVEDYTDYYPAILPNANLDLYGVDIILDKESAYPIQTYPYWEEKDKEKRLDPLATLAEVMSKLKSGETIWIQFLLKPTGNKTSDWKKEGKAIVDKMLGREKKEDKKMGVGDHAAMWAKNLAKAPFAAPTWEEPKKESEKKSPQLSSGDHDVIKAIENKLSKPGFETIIRFLYIDRRETFSRANVGAVMGALKQFNTDNMNSLKNNSAIATSKGGWIANLFPFYKKKVEYGRKRKIYERYKLRMVLPKTSVLNTEELATLYHVPTTMVEAPRLRRLEAKKAEPPPGLPIE